MSFRSNIKSQMKADIPSLIGRMFSGTLRKALFIKVLCISFAFNAASQSCPVYDKRNNGQGTQGCISEPVPAGKIKSGQFDFQNSSTSTTYTIDSILLNGQLYQKGQVLYNNLGTIWFGGYNGSNKQICFYGNNVNDNAPPAGRWNFFFKSNGTQTVCSYTLTGSGTLSSFSPGTISSDQTICSGETPASFLSVSSATGCSGAITYQWQSSTTSANSGFTNIGGATSATYSSGALTQTTYFSRIESCSDGASVNSNTVTVTVIKGGTLSGTQNLTTGQATVFASDGTSGGTWSSSNTNVASVNSSTGAVAAVSPGQATISYSVTSGGRTCTSSRVVNVTAPLPVSWLSFTAKPLNKQVVLDWSTATETNSRDFQIMHSTDGNRWNQVGTVNAAGTSNTTRMYQFVHSNPATGQNTYYIEQRDLDDRLNYSRIVEVILGKVNASIWVYPNPVQDQRIRMQTTTPTLMILYNSLGAEVLRRQLPMGTTTVLLPNLAAGVYRLRAGTETIPLVIQ